MATRKPATRKAAKLPARQHIAEQLMNGGKVISPEQYKELTEAEREKLHLLTVDKVNNYSTGKDGINWGELDKIYRLTAHTLKPYIKDYLLGLFRDHVMTHMLAISNNRTLPTVAALSVKTNLSKPVVSEVLKECNEYFKGDGATANNVQAELLKQVVYSQAMRGDMNAAKLFFAVTGTMNAAAAASTNIITQHNVINMNGQTVTPDELQSLPRDMQDLITGIIAENNLKRTSNLVKYHTYELPAQESKDGK